MAGNTPQPHSKLSSDDDCAVQEAHFFAYISVKDAEHSCVLSREKIEHDRIRIHSNTLLVRVLAGDESGHGGATVCERIRSKLRDIRPKSPKCGVYHPFKLINGDLLSLVKKHWRAGVEVKEHFVVAERKPKSTEDSPAVTVEHEVAIHNAHRAIMENRLKVYTQCDYPDHERVPIPVDQKWVPIGIERGCMRPLSVNGKGRDLVRSYHWRPTPDEFFNIDLAVLDATGERLLYAIEVQRSHANSASKRRAFELHGITDVQLNAAEINNVFSNGGIGVHDPVDRDIIVRHYPIDKNLLWNCPLCTKIKAGVEQEAARKRDEEEQEKKLLAHYEAQVVTTFDELTPGSYLRAFVHKLHKKTVYLSETGPLATEVKHPRYIQLRIGCLDKWSEFMGTFKPSDSKLVCLRLPSPWKEEDRLNKVVLNWQRGCFPSKGGGLPQKEFHVWCQIRRSATTYLMGNANRLVIRTLRGCGLCRHCPDWVAPSSATAEFHYANGFPQAAGVGSILVYDKGVVRKAIDVWNLPYKKLSDGPMRPVQICPYSVQYAIDQCDQKGVVTLLNTNHSAATCSDCDEKREQEQEKRRRAEEERRRAEEERRLAREEEHRLAREEERRRAREEERRRVEEAEHRRKRFKRLEIEGGLYEQAVADDEEEKCKRRKLLSKELLEKHGLKGDGWLKYDKEDATLSVRQTALNMAKSYYRRKYAPSKLKSAKRELGSLPYEECDDQTKERYRAAMDSIEFPVIWPWIQKGCIVML